MALWRFGFLTTMPSRHNATTPIHMKKVGFITCQEYAELAPDEQHLFPSFKKAGVQIIPLIWDQPINYDDFELLIFRSAWDYHHKPDAFFNWLQALKKIDIPVANPLSIIEENYDKYYLGDYIDKGFSVIPTLFFDSVQNIHLESILKERQWQKGVIKPAISMSAYHTYSFDKNNCQVLQDQLYQFYGNTKVLVQQFAPEITSDGEWSIVFFDKVYCMTARKKPKQGEFRVQSELGGSITYPEPPDHIIAEAKAILDSYEEDILYARMDGVIHEGHFQLMEAELIDPELYFRSGEKGRQAFLKAILNII